MLKLIVALFLGFQVLSVTPRSATETAAVAGSTMLAFIAVPGRLRRRRVELGAFDVINGEHGEDNLQYGAWGEARDGNTFGKATPFGFTGRWGGYSDSRLGQVLNWNRWYGPSAGRWGSRDPIGIQGGPNLYSYVGQSPILNVDDSGLKPSGSMPPPSPKPTLTPRPSGPATIRCDGKGDYEISFGAYENSAARPCIKLHEEQHIRDWKVRYPQGCIGMARGTLPKGGQGYDEFLRRSECAAHKIDIECLKGQFYCYKDTPYYSDISNSYGVSINFVRKHCGK